MSRGAMSQTASVIVERSGRVAVLKLNRPEVLNAFDAEMRCASRDRLRELAIDEQIRAVVITGEGRLFSSRSAQTRVASSDG